MPVQAGRKQLFLVSIVFLCILDFCKYLAICHDYFSFWRTEFWDFRWDFSGSIFHQSGAQTLPNIISLRQSLNKISISKHQHAAKDYLNLKSVLFLIYNFIFLMVFV